jgi:hypothetical protein
MHLLPQRRENTLRDLETGRRLHVSWWTWLGFMLFLTVSGCGHGPAMLGFANKVYEGVITHQAPVFDEVERAAAYRCQMKSGDPEAYATCMAPVLDARMRWDAALKQLESGHSALTNALPEMAGALEQARKAANGTD